MSGIRCYIVGLGPGDADLITLRGIEAIGKAELVLSTSHAKDTFAQYLPGKEWIEFQGMAWEKIHQSDEAERLEQIRRILQLRLEAKERIKTSVIEGKVAAVLLPGDPGFFSPMEWFVKNIPDQLLEIIPGISAVNAASAAMKRSLVSGRHTESVIITTPEAVGGVLPGGLVDKRRDTVEELARLRTNLVFFMALFNIGSLIARLRKIYPAQTPAAVVYKAGIRDEEKVVTGTLENIEKKICGEQQQFKGLFLVGPFINIHHKSLWERFYDKVL